MPRITFKTTNVIDNNNVMKTMIKYDNPTFDEMQEIINDVSKYRMFMKKHDNLLDKIPLDIFFNILIPNLNLHNLLILLHVNKSFNRQCQTFIRHFIKKDNFLFSFVVTSKDNILNTILSSSFRFRTFDLLYHNIKSANINPNDYKILLTIAEKTPYQNYHNQDYINNNFKIFQLLKMLSTKIKQDKDRKIVQCLITHGLQCYMDALFLKRHGSSLNNDLIQSNNLETDMMQYSDELHAYFTNNSYRFNILINTEWEYSQINIYNIYESMHCVLSNKTNSLAWNIDIKSIILYPKIRPSIVRFHKTWNIIYNIFVIKTDFVQSKYRRKTIKYIPHYYLLCFIRNANLLESDTNTRNFTLLTQTVNNTVKVLKTKVVTETNFCKIFKRKILQECIELQI